MLAFHMSISMSPGFSTSNLFLLMAQENSREWFKVLGLCTHITGQEEAPGFGSSLALAIGTTWEVNKQKENLYLSKNLSNTKQTNL